MSARDLAPSYKAHLTHAIAKALDDFVAGHPEVLAEAERCHLRTEAERAERDITDAEEQLGAAQAVLYAINENLKALPPQKEDL